MHGECQEQFIASRSIVVVQFWAEWNRISGEPLRQMLLNVSPVYASQINFAAVETDNEEMWELIKQWFGHFLDSQKALIIRAF